MQSTCLGGVTIGRVYLALAAACKAGSLAIRRVAAAIESPVSDIS
ncbi:12987_t:CDS:2 [Rhizophagus irregularis]|nr:12987_t:CDS:2 [Rhizophagus irregularis]